MTLQSSFASYMFREKAYKRLRCGNRLNHCRASLDEGGRYRQLRRCRLSRHPRREVDPVSESSRCALDCRCSEDPR